MRCGGGGAGSKSGCGAMNVEGGDAFGDSGQVCEWKLKWKIKDN